MKKKINPELLKEELNKFRLLSEYDFYDAKKTEPEYKELDEVDETPLDDEGAEDAATDISNDLGIDDELGDDTASAETPIEPDNNADPVQPPATLPPPPVDEPVDDGIEVDVTELVQGSEEAKNAAELASHNTELLLQKLADLESRVSSMDKVSAKIDSLEQEIIKRNPTPVEKLEMRSLSSYPYSQKLTDYWAEKEGPYDVMNTGDKKKEYILTQNDVDSGYSDNNVKQSFEVNPEAEYEEEDI